MKMEISKWESDNLKAELNDYIYNVVSLRGSNHKEVGKTFLAIADFISYITKEEENQEDGN